MDEVYYANAIEAYIKAAFGVEKLPDGLKADVQNLLAQHQKDFSDRVFFYARHEMEAILTRAFEHARSAQ